MLAELLIDWSVCPAGPYRPVEFRGATSSSTPPERCRSCVRVKDACCTPRPPIAVFFWMRSNLRRGAPRGFRRLAQEDVELLRRPQVMNRAESSSAATRKTAASRNQSGNAADLLGGLGRSALRSLGCPPPRSLQLLAASATTWRLRTAGEAGVDLSTSPAPSEGPAHRDALVLRGPAETPRRAPRPGGLAGTPRPVVRLPRRPGPPFAAQRC